MIDWGEYARFTRMVVEPKQADQIAEDEKRETEAHIVDEFGPFPALFECYNCGYMFTEAELNCHHLCQACASYLDGEMQP